MKQKKRRIRKGRDRKGKVGMRSERILVETFNREMAQRERETAGENGVKFDTENKMKRRVRTKLKLRKTKLKPE